MVINISYAALKAVINHKIERAAADSPDSQVLVQLYLSGKVSIFKAKRPQYTAVTCTCYIAYVHGKANTLHI